MARPRYLGNGGQASPTIRNTALFSDIPPRKKDTLGCPFPYSFTERSSSFGLAKTDLLATGALGQSLAVHVDGGV